MFPRTVLTIILSLIGVQVASAGVIIGDDLESECQISAEMMMPSDSSGNSEVEEGDFSSVGLIVTGSSTSSSWSFVATASLTVADSPFHTRVALANSILPPAPVLEGLLKPS